MTRYFQMLCCALGFVWLLPACQQLLRITGHRYHEISARAIANAELVDKTEIDTGRYVLLVYERYSNRAHRSDNWFSKNVFIQVRSLHDLPLGHEVAIPQPGITIATHWSATWYFESSQAVAGTIVRLSTNAVGSRLWLKLRYTDSKGKTGPLLDGTVFFRDDPTYFRRHRVDRKGKYDDLRLALKEPAKVKSLDLVNYAIEYEHRNGHDSGPDTLYRRLNELYNLETLNLSLSDLPVLPLGFEKLKRLKKLNLGYNHLTTFPMQLLGLDSLQELNLETNRLDSIPTAVSRFKRLKALNLSNNRLSHYPMAVNEIASLQELSLANANLRTMPIQIQQLANLRVLNVDGFWNNPRRNQLLDISALRNLPQLRALSIRSNGTSEQLLPQLYQLPALEELNLQYSGLDSAQVDLTRFPRMRKLILR